MVDNENMAIECDNLLTKLIQSERRFDINVRESFVVNNNYTGKYDKDFNVLFLAYYDDIPVGYIYGYVKDKNKGTLWPLEDLRWYLGQLSWLANVEPTYTEGVLTYYQNKYNIEIKESIISDIKSYNN